MNDAWNQIERERHERGLPKLADINDVRRMAGEQFRDAHRRITGLASRVDLIQRQLVRLMNAPTQKDAGADWAARTMSPECMAGGSLHKDCDNDLACECACHAKDRTELEDLERASAELDAARLKRLEVAARAVAGYARRGTVMTVAMERAIKDLVAAVDGLRDADA